MSNPASHVCGLQGFGLGLGDSCPACTPTNAPESACQTPRHELTEGAGRFLIEHATHDLEHEGVRAHCRTCCHAINHPPTPAAPQPETEGVTFDEWLRMRDNGGDVIKQCHGNAETCGYACRGWGGHNDECLRAAWTAAKKGGRSVDPEGTRN